MHSKIEEVHEEMIAWQEEQDEEEEIVEDEGVRLRPDHSPVEGRKLLKPHQENLFSFRSS